jgi:WD40 repeat protein
MKHSVQLFLATSFCITANISIAMNLESALLDLLEQKEKKAKILTEITCIKEPYAALYLTENRILINGRNQCSIVDSTTNKEIKRIFDGNIWSSNIAVHPHKTKFALSAYHYSANNEKQTDRAQQKITIYNAQTYEIESIIGWNYATTSSMRFSPLNDTIAVCQSSVDVILHNYTTNTTTTINVPEARHEHLQGYDDHSPIFSFHPTEPLMCLAWKTVYIHDLTTSTRKTVSKAPRYHNFCEYNPDGSFIAMGTSAEVNCIKPDHIPHFTAIPQKYTYFEGARPDEFLGMTMHPNGNIIMILSRTSKGFYTANYYDMRTSECITKIPVSLKIPCYKTYLSFSPSGKKLLMVAFDQCAELKVPFKVLYKNITKKQLSYLLFLLKNIDLKPDTVEIPHDVIQYMAKTVHEIYKRD